MDISKDSNYSTLLEDGDGSNAGNNQLDEHIESGDETQVDSQDEISLPQKGFRIPESTAQDIEVYIYDIDYTCV